MSHPMQTGAFEELTAQLHMLQFNRKTLSERIVCTGHINSC